MKNERLLHIENSKKRSGQGKRMQATQPRISGTDALGRYYTNDLVGRTLVREMNLKSPKLVVDLGAGDGSLSVEAAQLWTDAKFITVDIDDSISEKNSARLKQVNSSHHTYDVLNSRLHAHIGLELESADGGLCNPPYIRPRWRKEFGEILEDAGLSGILSSVQDISADVLFVAQNLRFLRSAGRLGLILPDGIIAGEKYTNLRKTLLSQHRIERVIELPRRIFRKTDAKAHIVILTKDGQSDETIAVQRLESDGSLSTRLQVPITSAIHRMDYSYIESQSSRQGVPRFALSDIYETLTRGQLSSVQVRSSLVPVFHSTDFPKRDGSACPNVPGGFLITKDQAEMLHTAIAQAGDILLCRVGRNLERKICFVPQGYVALSDCVYKLRVNSEFRQTVINFLCTELAQEKLKVLAHGVGAKYLSKEDILNFMVEII